MARQPVGGPGRGRDAPMTGALSCTPPGSWRGWLRRVAPRGLQGCATSGDGNSAVLVVHGPDELILGCSDRTTRQDASTPLSRREWTPTDQGSGMGPQRACSAQCHLDGGPQEPGAILSSGRSRRGWISWPLDFARRGRCAPSGLRQRRPVGLGFPFTSFPVRLWKDGAARDHGGLAASQRICAEIRGLEVNDPVLDPHGDDWSLTPRGAPGRSAGWTGGVTWESESIQDEVWELVGHSVPSVSSTDLDLVDPVFEVSGGISIKVSARYRSRPLDAAPAPRDADRTRRVRAGAATCRRNGRKRRSCLTRHAIALASHFYGFG